MVFETFKKKSCPCVQVFSISLGLEYSPNLFEKLRNRDSFFLSNLPFPSYFGQVRRGSQGFDLCLQRSQDPKFSDWEPNLNGLNST